MEDERLIHLLNLYLDGRLTTIEKEELETCLRESDAARRFFWSYTSLHGMTREVAKLKWATIPSPVLAQSPSVVGRSRGSVWGWHWGYAAAAALMVASLLSLGGLYLSGYLTKPVATLAQSVDAHWEQGDPIAVGSLLKPGRYHLHQGAVEITFQNGASLVCEAPASLELVSADKAHGTRGRYLVHVPESAVGFEFTGPGLRVLDLGTEFGLSLPGQGQPEVHVFDGEVELSRTATGQPENTLSLKEGEAALVGEDGYEPIPASRLGFPDAENLGHRQLSLVRDRQAAWAKASRALREDPATVLHYDFQGQTSWDSTLTNKVRDAFAGSHGAIVNAQWVEGRWPGRRALLLGTNGARIRLDLPQKLRSITGMIWIRPDNLPNSFTHSLMTGDMETNGTLRWTLSNAGEIRFAVANNRTEPGKEASWSLARSGKVVTQEMLGHWQLISFVHEGESEKARLYLNGEEVWKGKVGSPGEMAFGLVEVGNWVAHKDHPHFQFAKDRSKSFFDRHFEGAIDEVAVLGRVLSEEEIRQYFEAGRPASAP